MFRNLNITIERLLVNQVFSLLHLFNHHFDDQATKGKILLAAAVTDFYIRFCTCSPQLTAHKGDRIIDLGLLAIFKQIDFYFMVV